MKLLSVRYILVDIFGYMIVQAVEDKHGGP